MSDVINLNRARKQLTRKQEAQKAKNNRILYGTPKSLREKAKSLQSLEEKSLSGHILQTPPAMKTIEIPDESDTKLS